VDTDRALLDADVGNLRDDRSEALMRRARAWRPVLAPSNLGQQPTAPDLNIEVAGRRRTDFLST
jgi:hypothetical protein